MEGGKSDHRRIVSEVAGRAICFPYQESVERQGSEKDEILGE